ncbi:MAG: hypothetical protein KDA31_07265 [Phycisphaerales bacterium]|nr:hypothetical protein [Phycisphaerales bacterium]
MAHITRETLDNCFILIDGAIPNSDSLKEQYPHRRPMIRLDTGRFPPCEEERKAYLLTAHAMDIYARMAHGRVAEGGLETWVLNRSESGDGALDPWFEGQPEDYRVCIHRIGTDNGYSGSRPLRFCWGRAYARLGVTGKTRPIKDLTSQAIEILERVSLADGEGGYTRELAATGHPCAHSVGPVEPEYRVDF